MSDRFMRMTNALTNVHGVANTRRSTTLVRLPDDILSMCLEALGSLHDVARVLRTCNRWDKLSKRRKFWERVLRRQDRRFYAMIRLGLHTGNDGAWEHWSCIQNDAKSTVNFVQKIQKLIGNDRVAFMFDADARFFDVSVITQASLSYSIVIRPGLSMFFRFPNARRLFLDGSICEACKFEIPDDCQTQVEIRQAPRRYTWKRSFTRTVLTLKILIPVSITLFRQWEGIGGQLVRIDASVGCPIPNFFRIIAEQAVKRGSFMPFLAHLGWIQWDFDDLIGFEDDLRQLAETIFRYLDVLKVLLVVDDLADWRRETKRDKDVSPRRPAVRELVVRVWGVDKVKEPTFMEELTAVAATLAQQFTLESDF